MRTSTRSTVLAIALAGCAGGAPPAAPAPAPSTASRPATATPTTTSASGSFNATVVSDEIIARTNNERRSAKLPPLTRSVNLIRAAQLQADQMASAGVLDHTIPSAAYPTLSSRLAAVQYQMRAAGENIGEGYRGAAEAMAGWMGSAGHRANILSPNYTDIGVALARGGNGRWYYVQVFGRAR